MANAIEPNTIQENTLVLAYGSRVLTPEGKGSVVRVRQYSGMVLVAVMLDRDGAAVEFKSSELMNCRG